MTRQLVGVLAPLDAQGLLKRSMAYAMAALRNNTPLIRRTMEIFVTDPTVDWARNALSRQERFDPCFLTVQRCGGGCQT